jgi:hypothetical protein
MAWHAAATLSLYGGTAGSHPECYSRTVRPEPMAVHYLDEDFCVPICGRPRSANWRATQVIAEVRCARCSWILDRERLVSFGAASAAAR